jgi:hypothetical protein
VVKLLSKESRKKCVVNVAIGTAVKWIVVVFIHVNECRSDSYRHNSASSDQFVGEDGTICRREYLLCFPSGVIKMKQAALIRTSCRSLLCTLVADSKRLWVH